MTVTRNTHEFNKWWTEGGYRQWSKAVDGPILDAIEMVFLAGAASFRSPGCSTAEFYNGVLAALVLVDRYGEDSLYDEIVESVGADPLWAAAESHDREHLKKHGHSR